MLLCSFKHHLLYHRLSFAVTHSLFQRVCSLHQLSSCCGSVTRCQGAECLERKHDLLTIKNRTIVQKVSFCSGTLRYNSEKPSDSLNVEAITENAEGIINVDTSIMNNLSKDKQQNLNKINCTEHSDDIKHGIHEDVRGIDTQFVKIIGKGKKQKRKSGNRAKNVTESSVSDEVRTSEDVLRIDPNFINKASKGKNKELKLNQIIKNVDKMMEDLLERDRNQPNMPEVSAPEPEVPTIYKPKSILATTLHETKIRKKGQVYRDDELYKDRSIMSRRDQLKLAERGELAVGHVKKVPLPATVSLHDIVNESEVLQELVKIGVDLTSVQEKGMVETIMNLRHKEKLDKYVGFLLNIGVEPDHVGILISRCPWIFQHSLHNLQVRVDYLHSKKFQKKDIATMLDTDPKYLLVSVTDMDARLGFIQKFFKLTAKEIHEKTIGYSKLMIAPSFVLQQNAFVFEKELEFSKEDLKTMFMAYPKIFHRDSRQIVERFNYVHEVMGVPQELIAKTPQILSAQKEKLDSRHRFLVKCGRAQYDPTKENYVSLMSVISQSDQDWCFNVARSGLVVYEKFLKMI